MTPTTTLMPQLGFILLTLACAALLLLGLRRAQRKTAMAAAEQRGHFLRVAMGVALWLAVSAALALSGFLSNFSSLPPRFVVILVVPVLLTVLLLRSRRTRLALAQVHPAWIMALQVFRVPVELLLWRLHVEHAIPVQMSFEGWNFDVLTGLTAPLFAWLCYGNGRNRRWLAFAWNVGGFLLLVNIVTIALTSTPTPLRLFMNEPANTIVTTFPYVWLPAFLVPLAYGLHVMSWMRSGKTV